MRLKERQNENIITDRNVRDKCAEHYEVLERVKGLLLISGTDYAVIAQVADYYETGLEAIASLVKDNREELLEDGLVNASGQETKGILAKSSKNFANKSKSNKKTHPQTVLAHHRTGLLHTHKFIKEWSDMNLKRRIASMDI